MSAANPYESPLVAVEAPEDDTAECEYSTDDATIFAWEKLRVAYNLILAAIVLILGFIPPMQITNLKFWGESLGGAIGANICFCLGPVTEAYAVRLRVPRQIARCVIFIVGMLIAMFITFGATSVFLLSHGISDQN